MTSVARGRVRLATLDESTKHLVRLAAIIATGDEQAIRTGLSQAVDSVQAVWIEELILQSYLFCGFPRTLNAMREWRRLTGRTATMDVEGTGPAEWRRRGEATCRLV